MKNGEIQVGSSYAAKVSGKSVEVRIERVNPRGGWDAVSLGNNKKIRLKKGQSLRPLPEPAEPPVDGPAEAAVRARRGFAGSQRPYLPKRRLRPRRWMRQPRKRRCP